MDKDLVIKAVFDLTLEITRLKEELEDARNTGQLWFTEYTKANNKLKEFDNSKQEAIEPCTEQAEVTQAECFENMA